jgi:trk system potassium uptake protein TrkH
MSRILSVANVMGLIVVLFGCTLALPMGVSWWLDDGAFGAYDEAFVGAVIGGGVVWLLTRRFRRELTPRDGFLLVIAIWTGLPAVAALPLWFQIADLSFTDAYFEAASGFTATGATVLSGLEHLPPSINVWRTQLHWIGGLGIIVLAVAILPLLGVGGRQLYRAEIPGPLKDTRLTPRITETAKGFWIIYVVFTAACWTAYWLAGMGALDALIHAFSTMALGGFSSYDASLGHFDSPVIEAIAIVFMMIAAMSYATHFLAWHRRSPLAYWRDPEAFLFVGVLVASMLGIGAFLWLHGVYPDFWTALRYGAFNTASVATTLGFSTTDYAQWPVFAPIWMLFLCTFMTCSASTGGGIKLIRARLMLQQIVREMTQLVHPRAEVPLRVGGSVVPNKIIFAVLGFMALYGSTTLLVVFLLAGTGLDFITAVSAAVVCINNTGPGLGAVGPATTYAGLSDFQTWVCSAAMLLGRLELFTLLVIFSPHFWRH